eukprot:scaffold107945_cov63-Phaeocystis_antarctica.AAC.2
MGSAVLTHRPDGAGSANTVVPPESVVGEDHAPSGNVQAAALQRGGVALDACSYHRHLGQVARDGESAAVCCHVAHQKAA